MRLRHLLLSTLRHYWRTNLAILAGVAAATAVIGGALLVGASVRTSLQQMTLERLADVDHALTGGRFFREDLASALQRVAVPESGTRMAPAILLTGSLAAEKRTRTTAPGTRRAGSIQVFGVDERFWQMVGHGAIAPPIGNEVVLNRRAAEDLSVGPGDDVSLVVEIPASIPRDSLLGERNETLTELTLRVSAVADDEHTLGRFGLNPSQQLPRNAFVPLSTLQDQLGLAAVRRSPRNPVEKPARVNALFAHVESASGSTKAAIAPEAARQLSDTLQQAWTLSDLALRITINEEHGYCSLESEQLILDDTLVQAAERTAERLRLTTSPVLVYLVNEISNASDPEAYSMYSVAAGIEFADQPPFGPFDWQAAPDGPLKEGEIVVNDWLAQDLKVTRGDRVLVKYHQVGDRGELPEIETEFRIAGIVRLTGAADDRGFTPEVPGITDVESLDDWRQPFPLKLSRVTTRDDEYWDPHDESRKAYRATPKIFLPLDEAQELWRSRYGRLTSFRFAPRSGQSLDEAARAFEREFLAHLNPVAAGLAFQPVKFQGLQAAQGTTDFAGLFIGFSFFLILAAAILVGLLFRLNLERRLSELGLLQAVGFSPKQIRQLMLLEGSVLVVAGGVIGTALAVGFAALMIHGLTTWWVGAVGTTFLRLDIDLRSLAYGFLIAAVVAGIAILWAMRRTRGISTRNLLAGTIEPPSTPRLRTHQRRTARVAALSLGGIVVVLLLVSLAGFVPNREAFAGLTWPAVVFFLMGVASLLLSLSLLADRLSVERTMVVRGNAALLKLALRNAGRQRGRSLLTVGLIAAATFVIVAIAAGHRDPAAETPIRNSGNGGFSLVAETSVPLLFDLNTEEGRNKLGVDPLDPAERQLLAKMRVAALRVRTGEDASCLNLYRTQLPTILGVPEDVLEEWSRNGRFRFLGAGGHNPWDLLHDPQAEGEVPVIGDMNTLQYSLHLGVGETLDVPQSDTRLRIAGMLDGSVFQGVLLMSETHFHRLFPDQAGFRYFLIETEPALAPRLSQLLESELGDYGFDAERVVDRIAGFLAVQNTYLSTFQTLGGLGLLLGTFGLGTVMLRNVLERRGELALMRAVGFRNPRIALLVLSENAWLMLWGLAAGVISALVAMTPHLTSTGADVPWRGLLLMLGSVAIAGMLAAAWAVRNAVSAPILQVLRGE